MYIPSNHEKDTSCIAHDTIVVELKENTAEPDLALFRQLWEGKLDLSN